MVVNDTGLIAVMNDALKATGYTVAGTGTEEHPGMMICTGYWAVVLLNEIMPPKVLGKIAEHARRIPRPGEAFRVRKSNVQDEIYEMAIQTVRNLQTLAKEEDLQIVKPTSLTLGGWNIWQQPETLDICKIDPKRQKMMLLGGKESVYLLGNTIYVEDGVSAVFVVCEETNDTEEPMIQHLEQMQWVTAE